MPELKTGTVSRNPVNLPRYNPAAMAEADAALAQGGARVAAAGNSLIEVQSYISRFEKTAEAATIGEPLVQSALSEIEVIGSLLRRPKPREDGSPGNAGDFDAAGAKKEFARQSAEVLARVQQDPRLKDNLYAQKYVSLHLGTAMRSASAAFNGAADKQWQEVQQFRIAQNIRGMVQEAANIASGDATLAAPYQENTLRTRIHDQIGAGIGVFYTAEQAIAYEKEVLHELDFGVASRRVIRDPDTYYAARKNGENPFGLAEADNLKLDTVMREAFITRDHVREKQDKADKAVVKADQDRARIETVAGVVRGTVVLNDIIKNAHKYSAEDFSVVTTLARAVEKEKMTDEKQRINDDAYASLSARINSPLYAVVSAVTDAEIMALVKHQQITGHQGGVLMNERHARLGEMANKAETLYDKRAAEALGDIRRHYQQPSLLKLDQSFSTAESIATLYFNEMVRANRDKVDKEGNLLDPKLFLSDALRQADKPILKQRQRQLLQELHTYQQTYKTRQSVVDAFQKGQISEDYMKIVVDAFDNFDELGRQLRAAENKPEPVQGKAGKTVEER